MCFVKFASISSCQTALHLTNSILVDRALIVVNSRYGEPETLSVHAGVWDVSMSGYGRWYKAKVMRVKEAGVFTIMYMYVA